MVGWTRRRSISTSSRCISVLDNSIHDCRCYVSVCKLCGVYVRRGTQLAPHSGFLHDWLFLRASGSVSHSPPIVSVKESASATTATALVISTTSTESCPVGWYRMTSRPDTCLYFAESMDFFSSVRFCEGIHANTHVLVIHNGFENTEVRGSEGRRRCFRPCRIKFVVAGIRQDFGHVDLIRRRDDFLHQLGSSPAHRQR